MPVEESKILDLIQSIVEEMNSAREDKLSIERDTPLIGEHGVFDSIDLVHFVSSLEDALSDEFDSNVSLVDENIMELETSPFRDVDCLVKHIQKILG